MSESTGQLDLATLFQTVAGALAENRTTLNQADSLNQNHGDNMVQIFEMISKAMQEKKNADPASQLAHAGQMLSKQKSGSSQVYAQGLAQASREFKGQSQIDPQDVLRLLTTLMGGGQASTGRPSAGTADALTSLLTGLGTAAAGSQARPDSSEIDLNDLLNAGMAFMNAKQQGSNNLQALVKALVSDSPLSQSDHRAQSGALVANSILQAISAMSRNK
jgi:hypothetical protein